MAVTFERRFNNVRRLHTAYESVEEAEERLPAGITPIPWHTCRVPGQWGVTDDGCVVECVKVRAYRRRAGKRPKLSVNLVFSVGPELFVRYDAATGRVDGLPEFNARPELERPEGPVGIWKDRDVNRSRSIRAVKVLARIVVFRGRPTEEHYRFVGRIYRPELKRPDKQLKRFLNTEQGKEMLANEIAQLFEKAGVPPSKVVQFQDEVRSKAVEMNTVSSLKLAYEVTQGWAEMLGMRPDPDAAPEPRYDDEAYYDAHLLEEGDDGAFALPSPRKQAPTNYDDEADALAAEILEAQ